MKLKLFDINPAVCEAFEQYFDRDNVEIVCCSLESLTEYDCIVSPGNSFGLMDGGIDKYIIKKFGTELMHKVQQHIIHNFSGEQPVGTSFIIGTENNDHPYLVHTPTMRIPMKINNSDNVYLAMKALLNEVKLFNLKSRNAIKTVACSGLGTATGGVSPSNAAKQMSLAYEHVLYSPIYKIDWNTALLRSREIFFSTTL
ncbi:RNase III inhibitor [compost metagenome]